MAESVYIETSVFSLYHGRQTAPAVIAMCDWTHHKRADAKKRVRSVERTMFTKLLAALLTFTIVSPALAQELALKIEPPAEAIHVGDYPKFMVTISNQGEKPLTLVELGDGSDCRWRTPDLKVSGLPLGEHEEGAIEKIQYSYPCELISNEVIVEVLPKKE